MKLPYFTVSNYLRTFHNYKEWHIIHGSDLYIFLENDYIKLPGETLLTIKTNVSYRFINPAAFITFRGIWANYLWTHQ